MTTPDSNELESAACPGTHSLRSAMRPLLKNARVVVGVGGILLGQALLGPSLLACGGGGGGGDENERDSSCMPNGWDDAKWQVPTGQQIQTPELMETEAWKQRQEDTAPFWEDVEVDPSVDVGHELAPATATVIGTGRDALADVQLIDEEVLAQELEERGLLMGRTLEEFTSGSANVQMYQPSSEAATSGDGEPIAQTKQAVTDVNGNEGVIVREERSSVVAINVTYWDGTTTRATGVLVANNVLITAAHTFMEAQNHFGVQRIEILVPAGPRAPNRAPASMEGIAYQVEPNYTHPNGDDDVALVYFRVRGGGRLPTRAQPLAPVTDYEAAVNCQNPGNCVAQVATIHGTRVFNNGEWARPRTRGANSTIYHQEDVGNASFLYIWPPITQPGDSGGPVWIAGQFVGIVWGVRNIPITYRGQAAGNHPATTIQVLNHVRVNQMVTNFENAVRNNLANGNNYAPWTTVDGRFGVIHNLGYNGWTTRTLATALAAIVWLQQHNPPQGGCRHP